MNQFQNTSKFLNAFASLCIIFLVMVLFFSREHSVFGQETSIQGIKLHPKNFTRYLK